jgi:hypothetical protein
VYDVDGDDRVTELSEVPQSSVGTPLPVVVANEWTLHLAYLIQVPDRNWDGTYVVEVDLQSANPVALVTFAHASAWFHGPPNDEAFAGHPLAQRGLEPYGAFRVENSSWVRRLERMNVVHPRHRPGAFVGCQHFVFAFHDSTFECVADGLDVVVVDGPLKRVAEEMVRRL